MELKKAQAIAEDVVKQLSPHCEKVEVAGSIRRRRPLPNDIDIVLVPKPLMDYAVHQVLMELGGGKMKMAGKKIARVDLGEIELDVYIATEETWSTLLLIRTGSKESNQRLAAEAQRRGWRLAASGGGLFNENNERIAGDTEASIFKSLGFRNLEPWERD